MKTISTVVVVVVVVIKEKEKEKNKYYLFNKFESILEWIDCNTVPPPVLLFSQLSLDRIITFLVGGWPVLLLL